MHDREFSITLEEIIREFNLEVIYGPEGFEKVEICHDDVNRPGIQLMGFFEDFDSDRIQIMGRAEAAYLRTLDEIEREKMIDWMPFRRKPSAMRRVSPMEPLRMPSCLLTTGGL